MPSFTEEFERNFEDARQRVFSKTDRQKRHGKASEGSEAAYQSGTVSIEDFHAYMPMHKYIFEPSGELWPAASIDSRLPGRQRLKPDGTQLLDNEGKPKVIKASRWLDQNKPVEQMTWAPGLPALIRNRLISEGGWIERNGVTCFNLIDRRSSS